MGYDSDSPSQDGRDEGEFLFKWNLGNSSMRNARNREKEKQGKRNSYNRVTGLSNWMYSLVV